MTGYTAQDRSLFPHTRYFSFLSSSTIHKETTLFIICINHRLLSSSGLPSCCGHRTSLFIESNANGPAFIVDDGDKALLECALNPKVLPASLILGGLERFKLGKHSGRAVLAVLQMKAAECSYFDVQMLLGQTLDPDYSGSLLLAAELATDGAYVGRFAIGDGTTGRMDDGFILGRCEGLATLGRKGGGGTIGGGGGGIFLLVRIVGILLFPENILDIVVVGLVQGHRLGRPGTTALLGSDGGRRIPVLFGGIGIGLEYCLLLGDLGRLVDKVQLEDILQEVAMLRVGSELN